PASAVCQELGSPNTPFLKRPTKAPEAPGPGKDTLVIRNADTSFVYFPKQDGVFAPVPAQDLSGLPTDFSRSASLKGARELDLIGQGIYDPFLFTTHLGILNSPDTWAATLRFLGER